MAAQALGPGTTIVRRRAFFGLLDAGGWAWATLKAAFWFVAIIMLMAYIPDRALYATVQPTIEIGVPLQTFNKNLNVTPVNLCPPSIETLPCPAPVGAVLPWQPNPPELGLPAGAHGRGDRGGRPRDAPRRRLGREGRPGQRLRHRHPGGRQHRRLDGRAHSLPAPRAGAAAVFFAGSAFVIGGTDETGAPTDTVFKGTPDAASGKITSWTGHRMT